MGVRHVYIYFARQADRRKAIRSAKRKAKRKAEREAQCLIQAPQRKAWRQASRELRKRLDELCRMQREDEDSTKREEAKPKDDEASLLGMII